MLYYFTCYSHVIRMPFVCAHMSRMSSAYHSFVNCMSLVCSRMSSVCQLYVTRMQLYVIRMSIVCTRMSSVCHLCVLVCHPYVTCLWFYHEPFISNLITWNLSKSIFYIRISTKKQAFDFFKRNSFTNSCLKFLCVGKLIASLINFKFLAKIWRQFTWVFIHLMILKLVDLNL